MALWKAKQTCYVQGVLLEGGGVIELTEEQEKAEKLGKYAEEVPDQRALRRDPGSKKTVKIGNQHLIKVNRAAVAGQEGKPIDDGMILYPPVGQAIQRATTAPEGIHATTFQNTR